MRVAATCQVHGKDWLLSGTVQYNSTLKHLNPLLSVDNLNLPELLPDKLVKQQLGRPEWKHLPALTAITSEKLKLPSEITQPEWNMGADHSYHIGWIIAGVSMAVSVGFAILIWKKLDITPRCEKVETESRDAETASEMQSLGPTWVAITQHLQVVPWSPLIESG